MSTTSSPISIRRWLRSVRIARARSRPNRSRMPVLVDRGPGGCALLAGKESAAERLKARRHPAGSEWIEIGLVNNMPEAALEATEQQFLELLEAAAGDSWIHLRFFALPGVPRGERGRSYLSQSYCDTGDISRADLDGMIVTGTEP